MDTSLSLAGGVAAVIVVVSLFQAALLVFRYPHRPAWLRPVEACAAITFTAAFAFALALLISSLVSAGVPVLASLALAALLPLATGTANARVFGLTERLRRAEAGESPFGQPVPSHGQAPAVQPVQV